MKITRIFTDIFEFDIDQEIKRLKECFKGHQLQRQMNILHAMFVEKNIEKVMRLYYSLPECKKHGCTEMEYVGMWMEIFSGNHCGTYLIKRDTVYDFDKFDEI